MKPTPRTDAVNSDEGWVTLEKRYNAMHDLAEKLETLLGEARDALRWSQGELGKHTRPSPIDNVLTRIDATLAGANPDYVDAPMQVSVTTIDPATGEVKQGVATTDEELRTLLDDERDVDAFQTDPFDSDLDEPLPPKQCGIDDPECESCS